MKQPHQIKMTISDFRAIKNANIVLDGITVITGENGCGKSTISKLAYHFLKTSIHYDEIVDKKVNRELRRFYSILEDIVMEIYELTDNKEFKPYRFFDREELRETPAMAIDVIDKLMIEYKKVDNGISPKPFKRHFKHLTYILRDELESKDIKEETDVVTLLLKVKEAIQTKLEKAETIKETRPMDVLEEALYSVFDEPLSSINFNIEEHEEALANKNKFKHIHTIQKVAYMDTPMALGVHVVGRNALEHWEDLNEILAVKGHIKPLQGIEGIFKSSLKGDIVIEDNAFNDFSYRRKDGKVFDLLECATGLKSFAILRMLYKNGFLDKETLLIIDEPEAHLHPKWVVEYARLLVLLHKKIGVRFLIASHHSEMVSAIKYIAEKEKVEEKSHFYAAESNKKEPFLYDYKDCGTNIEKVFASFNIAFERIDQYGSTE